jgi:hypothetical protein
VRTVAVVVGADTVSSDVVSFFTSRRTLQVGSFAVTIRNVDGEWTGDFAAKDTVTVSVQDDDDAVATQIFKGYLETATPYYGLDHEQFIDLTGKCRGAPLDWRWYSKKYEDDKGDAILEDIFDTSGELAELTFNNLGTAAAIDYEAREGVYFSQILREIGEIVDYDGYIKDDDTIQFFAVGANSSGVTLTDTTNILKLRYTELDSVNLRNYIKLEGPQVWDGWSENDVSAYDACGTNTTLTAETTVKIFGAYSIEGQRTGAAPAPEIGLDISSGFDGDSAMHQWTSIDVSGEQRKLSWFGYADGATDQWVELTDTNSDQISWHSLNVCDLPTANTWYYCELGIGMEEDIAAFGTLGTDAWEYLGAGNNFNWIIEKISWYADNLALNEKYYIDGIGLPVNLISINQNAASQASYGKRKLYLRRPDVKTQDELDDLCQWILAKRKDPQKLVEITAAGNTSLVYPGETVVVTSSDEGLTATSCRIVEVRHRFNTLFNPVPGRDYVTELVVDPQTSIVSDGEVISQIVNPKSRINVQSKVYGKWYERAVI